MVSELLVFIVIGCVIEIVDEVVVDGCLVGDLFVGCGDGME